MKLLNSAVSEYNVAHNLNPLRNQMIFSLSENIYMFDLKYKPSESWF